jgi:GNAT superfamily N-acetyltransferase
MNIHSASVQELSVTMYRRLYSLNHREDGYMREVLTKCKHGHPEFYNGEVAYIEDNNNILAWSLVFKHTYYKHEQHIIHLYTRKSHRGKGLASKLIDFWTDRYNNLRGHQDNSSIFQRYAVRQVLSGYTCSLK